MPLAAALGLAVALLAGVCVAPGAAAERAWRWPVRGEIITPFAVGADPFARGQHRGIDIAARAGARVGAACAGRVRFAGRVPGRGRAVTVTCGRLVATHLELGRTVVRRGDRVTAGAPIGTVAASHLQLGARRMGRRHGYVDPLSLLGDGGPPDLGPVPPARRHRRPLPAPARPVAVPRPITAPAPAPAAVPLAAWIGLGALAAATPLGGLLRRRRRLRARRVAAAGPASTSG